MRKYICLLLLMIQSSVFLEENLYASCVGLKMLGVCPAYTPTNGGCATDCQDFYSYTQITQYMVGIGVPAVCTDPQVIKVIISWSLFQASGSCEIDGDCLYLEVLVDSDKCSTITCGNYGC